MRGDINNKVFLSDYLAGLQKDLSDQIKNLEITDSTNIDSIIDKLISEYRIDPLELEDPIPSKPRETSRQRKNMWDEHYTQNVFEISVKFPFKGNSYLFSCTPSTCTIVYLETDIRINHNYISTNIVLEVLDANEYKKAIEKIKSKLSSNIPSINLGISPWNNNLESTIKNKLQQRKSAVSKKFDFMEQIGLNVNPKSDDYMIPSPVTKKKIPIPVSDTTKSTKREFIPILQEEVYSDIKEVLYNVGKAIERKPSLYKDKYEEDLRDIFLLFLETRYDSTSGVGEAFNSKGKTDILLKYVKDGSNLFVAECKFWSGQKGLLNAINQLLGYLTHRDSKTALMIFVDRNEMTSIIENAKNRIRDHSYYKRFVKENYNSSISYEFSLPNDSKKIIQIEVMFFHFPK